MSLAIKDGSVTVGTANLETRHIGPPPSDAPTIVMLHEGLGAITTWRDFPERLAEATGYGVFVYARRGYGRSSPCALPRPLDYMTYEAVEGLPVLLDAIGFRRGVLLGHSDGASIAAIHSGHFDDRRIDGAILLAPHFFTEEFGLKSIAAARDAYQTTDLRERLRRHHGDNVDCAFNGWAGAWLHPDFRHWDVREYLPGISTPMLVIQGIDDQYGTVAHADAARQLSGGRVDVTLLEACAHAPFRDQPQATLEAAGNFIRSIASTNYEL